MKAYYTYLFIFCFFASHCSDKKIKIAEPYELGDVPDQILKIESKDDPFVTGLKVEMKDLPGHDDLIFNQKEGVGYASGMDGWIWKLDLRTGHAAQWVRPPVNPAGMQFSNQGKDRILVCASKLGGETYDTKDRVGLYEVEISTQKVTPLVLDLPKTKGIAYEKVYTPKERIFHSMNDLDNSNSRPFSLCNDLAISRDGNRIYMTEPFEREDAAMGSGAVPEAIGLYPHGKLWMYDRKKNAIVLLLNGFTFVDGILLEENLETGEESVIFSETTKFRILRAKLIGKNEGSSEILFENLPGLADGLEKDEFGRIWVGIIKPRSKLINFVHRHPWLKPLLLSLPHKILPIAKKTGIMVLDGKGENAIYYLMHDGSKIRDISVAVPFDGRVYFPSFEKSSRGLYSIGISDLKF
jgi:sugar lactone lactonase YvrE